MKKFFKFIIVIYILSFFISCSTSQLDTKDYSLLQSEPNGSSIVMEEDDSLDNVSESVEEAKQTDKNTISSALTSDKPAYGNSFNGLTNHSKVFYKDKLIIINHAEGFIDFDNTLLEILKKSADGWALRDTVDFRLLNSFGVEIKCGIEADKSSGIITVKPDKELDPLERYVLFTIIDSKPYESVILASSDNISAADSYFSNIQSSPIGFYKLSDLALYNKGFFSFNFSENPIKLLLWISSLEKDADVYLTVYHTLNGSKEVIRQRWKKSGKAIASYLWKSGKTDRDTTKKIVIDEDDGSLDGFTGFPDYSTTTLYLEIKVLLNGKDITSQSEAVLNVVNYYSYLKNNKK